MLFHLNCLIPSQWPFWIHPPALLAFVQGMTKSRDNDFSSFFAIQRYYQAISAFYRHS